MRTANLKMAHTAHIGYGVRTFETGRVRKSFARFRDIGVRDSRPYPIWAVWAIFKLAVRILESFETNEILVKLRTGQDLETGRV